ncbi:hypothetical protein GPA19_13180, partial [Azoarcus indigens]|nr:hypothetical protein [Azoarcus indigens]
MNAPPPPPPSRTAADYLARLPLEEGERAALLADHGMATAEHSLTAVHQGLALTLIHISEPTRLA